LDHDCDTGDRMRATALPGGRIADPRRRDRNRSIVYASMQFHPRMIIGMSGTRSRPATPGETGPDSSPSDRGPRAICVSTVDVMITSIALMTLNVGHRVSASFLMNRRDRSLGDPSSIPARHSASRS
jgi:hypothetical protein